VGKAGKLGERVRCVVSVSMLTEGWDANTVTHILGIRAFGTQLLCEQVVGRALRRRSYPTGVDVFAAHEDVVEFGGTVEDAREMRSQVRKETTLPARADDQIPHRRALGAASEMLRSSRSTCRSCGCQYV
jgi:type III restriction enzyme